MSYWCCVVVRSCSVISYGCVVTSTTLAALLTREELSGYTGDDAEADLGVNTSPLFSSPAEVYAIVGLSGGQAPESEAAVGGRWRDGYV